MPLSRGQLIDELTARKQYYFVGLLKVAFGGEEADLSPSCVSIEANGVDDFVNRLIQQPDYTAADKLINGETSSSIGSLKIYWSELKISLCIAKICKELNIDNELAIFLEKLFTDDNLRSISEGLNAKAEIRDVQIKKLIKAINAAIAAIGLNNPVDQINIEAIKNALVNQYTTLPPNQITLKLFNSVSGLSDDVITKIAQQAKLASLRLELIEWRPQGQPQPPQGVQCPNFIQILDKKRNNVAIKFDMAIPDKESSFRTNLYNNLMASPHPNNSPAAFADVLNDLLGLQGNEALNQDNPLLRDAANELSKLFSSAKQYYLQLISSPEVQQQPNLLTLFRNKSFMGAVINAWENNGPVPTMSPADLVAAINDALKKQQENGAPANARQALARLLFNEQNIDKLDAPVKDPGEEFLNVDDSQQRLVIEARYFHKLKQHQVTTPLKKTSPAFAEMLMGLAKLQPAQLAPLQQDLNLDGIQNLNLVDEDLAGARIELAKKCFAKADITSITDKVIYQIIGEARLKAYLGDAFTEMFANTPKAVSDDYLALCQQVGAYPTSCWKIELEKLVQTTLNQDQQPDKDNNYHRYLRGYLWLRKVYGEEFAANLPVSQLRAAAITVNALPNSNAKQQRLDNFKNQAVDKTVPATFRTFMGDAKQGLLPAVPDTTAISDDVADNAVGILRVQAFLDKRTISALHKTDPQLISMINDVAQRELLWKYKLSQIQTCIKPLATRTDLDRGEAAAVLATQLSRYLETKIPAGVARVLLGNYRAELLKETMAQQDLPGFANLIDLIEIDGASPIRDYLAEYASPADLIAKFKELQKYFAGQIINADALPDNVDVNLRAEFEKFLAELVVPEALKKELLDKLLPNTGTNKFTIVKELFADALYKQLLDITKQYVGLAAVERLKLIETQIKDQIRGAVDADGKITQAETAHFKSGALIIKAKAFRGDSNNGLIGVDGDIAARTAVQTFLTGLVEDPQAAAKVVVDNSTQAVNPNNQVYNNLKQSAKDTKIIADIEEPAIAQWLQDYRDKNDQALVITHKHVYAINKMLHAIGDAVVAAPDVEKKKRLIMQEINHLKSLDELPDNFPAELFVNGDGTENKEYPLEYWLKNFQKMNILRKITHPVMRQFALNDNSFLRDYLTSDVLLTEVNAVNDFFDNLNDGYLDDKISQDEYNNLFNNNNANAPAFANFAKNIAMVQSLTRDCNRVRAIRDYVNNSEMAEALINNSLAFAGYDKLDNLDKDVQAFAAGLKDKANLADKTVFHTFLRTQQYRLDDDKIFYELYTDQFFKNVKEPPKTAKGKFIDYGVNGVDFTNDKESVQKDIDNINRAAGDFTGRLKKTEQVLARIKLERYFMRDSKENLAQAEGVKKSLAGMQAGLVEIKQRIGKEKIYLDNILGKLDEIEGQKANPFCAAVEKRSQVLVDIASLKREVKSTQTRIDNLLKRYNKAIDNADDLLQKMDEGMANLKKTPVVEGEGVPKRIYFAGDENMRFYAELVDPSNNPVSSAMRAKYSVEGIDPPNNYVDLKRPADRPKARYVFTSKDTKTIVRETDESTLLIESFPGRSPESSPAIKNDEYKNIFENFANAYAIDPQGSRIKI